MEELLVAKYLYDRPVHDKRHALLIHEPAERSKRRSELSWSFAAAIVNACNASTIVAGSQRPVLADELRRLDEWFARRFGEAALPSGHGNLQWLLPPDLPLPPHRAAPRQEANEFSGAPVRAWPPTLFYYDAPAVQAGGSADAMLLDAPLAAAGAQPAPQPPRNVVLDDAVVSGAEAVAQLPVLGDGVTYGAATSEPAAPAVSASVPAEAATSHSAAPPSPRASVASDNSVSDAAALPGPCRRGDGVTASPKKVSFSDELAVMMGGGRGCAWRSPQRAAGGAALHLFPTRQRDRLLGPSDSKGGTGGGTRAATPYPRQS